MFLFTSHKVGDNEAKLTPSVQISTGDFNCILGASAASSYLSFGSVEPGVPEWGRPCPPEVARVPPHGYTSAAAGGMQSAHECSSAANVTGTWSFGEEFTCVALALLVSYDYSCVVLLLVITVSQMSVYRKYHTCVEFTCVALSL